ncbi:MAG: hypothetical protein V3S14_02075, partial [Anaerolineae bacterium]
EENFSLCTACHGADGTTLNFGSAEEPEYLGGLADGNPWEVLHKTRFGQPDSAMPSTIDLGWSVQDAVDVLAYAQTLPTGEEEAAVVLPASGGSSLPWIPLALTVLGLLTLALGLALLISQVVRRVRP